MQNKFEVKFKIPTSISNDFISKVKKIESYEEIKLPKLYVDFIKEFNGCIPIHQRFNLINGERFLEMFLCILEDPNNEELDGLGVYDTEVVVSQIGERLTSDGTKSGVELYPIAVLFGGDYICLDYRISKDNPSICIWSHDESEDFCPVVYHVAESFEKFLNMLF